jgi:hypothetical protein
LKLLDPTTLGYLPPEDLSTLAFVEQYLKFRQGQVWQAIKQELEGAGMELTQEDR